jgi:hypothetical protein
MVAPCRRVPRPRPIEWRVARVKEQHPPNSLRGAAGERRARPDAVMPGITDVAVVIAATPRICPHLFRSTRTHQRR